LCKKVFAAFGGRIFFGWRLVFHDFAKRNHEKQVSIQILFGAKRQEKPFYTTSTLHNPKEILGGEAADILGK